MIRKIFPLLLIACSCWPAQAQTAASVSPLLTTEWGQTAPYNNLCPEYADGRRCKTSCVATAMAQIMRYHGYPLRGTGEKSMQWHYGDRSATLTADFSATQYQWAKMLDCYSGSYSPEEAEAVATIMYQSGIACDAEYTPDSGAYIDDAYAAMTTYFGYSKESVLADREDFDDTTWNELLHRTLTAGVPVYYGGYTASYLGHAFVIDGYDANGQLHVNWGFSSGGDYYPLNGLGSYVYGQSAMIFYPTQRPSSLPAWMACTPGIILPVESVERTEGAELTLKIDLKNYTGRAPEVTFALRLTSSADGSTDYVIICTRSLPDNRYVSLQELSLPLASLPAEGNYSAEIVYRQTDGDEWTALQPTRVNAPLQLHLSLSPAKMTAGTSSLSVHANDCSGAFDVTGNVVRVNELYRGTVEIIRPDGWLMARLDRNNPQSSPLPHGIYIINTGTASTKLSL
ncbi:MAG: C10 family peptidase [Duncaniella sp.]|nr:C10 family peptidase [Duncaniella sp.]